MEVRSLKHIAAVTGGKILAGLPEAYTGPVCLDSRAVKAGDLFIAIKGDKFDAHDFLSEVAAKKISGVVIAESRVPAVLPGCPVVAVPDTRLALGRLAAAHRTQFSLPVVGVGGSNGKTSTKELIAAVLRQKFATLWSEASFNNDIGVPLTLLKLTARHQAAVVELGTNHPGELAPLVKLAQPTLGIITTVGREHLEFFGDVAGVAQEEGALAAGLPATGALFLNGDNEWTPTIATRTQARVVKVGLGEGNDWRATGIRFEARGMSFTVAGPRTELNGEYRINLLGRHQVGNALFAVALGAELGLAREEILRGLAEGQPAKMRLQLWEAGGVTVLDDSYNANADSVVAALQVLAELPCKGRRIAVLGDMAELGITAEAAHTEVGACAAKSGAGILLAVGKFAAVMGAAARAGGMSRVMEFADSDSLAGGLKNLVKPGDVVLFKASRAARLERVTEVLKSGMGGK